MDIKITCSKGKIIISGKSLYVNREVEHQVINIIAKYIIKELGTRIIKDEYYPRSLLRSGQKTEKLWGK